MKQSKVIHYTLSAALLFSITGLAGCGTNGNNVTSNNARNGYNQGRIAVKSLRDGRTGVNSARHGVHGLTTQNNHLRKHNLENLKADQKLSGKIATIKGVDRAHVLVNDNTAYVAVSLKGNNTIKKQSSTTHMNSTSRNGYVRNNNSINYGTGQLNQAMDGSGNQGRGLYGARGTGSYGMLRDLGTNHLGTNATGTLSEEEYLPADMKSKITAKVKKAAPHIQHVHVSANPEFVTHMRSMTTSTTNQHSGIKGNAVGSSPGTSVGNAVGDIGSTIGNTIGNTVGALSTGFGELVNRIFPLNDGTNNLNQPINNKRSNIAPNGYMTR